MTDDLYEHLIYDDNEFHTFASIAPELKERILTLNGVSGICYDRLENWLCGRNANN